MFHEATTLALSATLVISFLVGVEGMDMEGVAIAGAGR